jgi:hypothetical protein
VTDAISPIGEAAAAIRRLTESILSDRPDDIADILDSLADSDGPLSPLRDFLNTTAGWIDTLTDNEPEDARHNLDNATSSLDEAIEAIQNAAAGLRTATD